MLYMLYDNSHSCGQTVLMRQAIEVAKRCASRTGHACIVEAQRLADGVRRRVQYNPDGSMIQLWKQEV